MDGPLHLPDLSRRAGDLTHIGGSTSRATVTLAGAGQASLPASLGSYTQANGTCTSYCHGATLQGGTRTAILWSDTNLACNACHFIANPPTPHPAVDNLGAAITSAAQCSQCHPDTVNTDGTIKVAGGLHVNGVIDGGGHGDYTAPAIHGPAFFDYLRGTGLDCKSCHGQDLNGGSAPSCNACHVSNGWTANWQINCSFCHGTRSTFTRTNLYSVNTYPTLSAPPDALSQRLTGVPDASRTGAHQAHLTGRGSSSSTFYSNPIPCATCHAIPADYAHAGGPGRAPVTLTGTGSLPASLGTYSQTNATCSTYCHSPSVPVWTGGELGCGGCHGLVPASGEHELHLVDLASKGYTCANCHVGTVDFQGAVNAQHLDGLRQVEFSGSSTTWTGSACFSDCHDSGEARRW